MRGLESTPRQLALPLEGRERTDRMWESFSPAAQVRIKRGTHTGYVFEDGVMTAYKTMTLSVGRLADASELRSLPGQTGLWFHMTSGNWSGRWLRASDVVYLE